MNDRPYIKFAQAIVAARKVKKLVQPELAQAIGVRQQSVSRWEAGTHRPSPKQLHALAMALELRSADLTALLDGPTIQVSAAVPLFPVDQLGPETFEQFVADLAHAETGATVRRAGASGHTQDGWDVRAVHSDQTVTDYQVKRVVQFGPGDVRAAIDAYKGPAERKILVLSRVISPQAAQAILNEPGWSVLDKDDLSRLIRRLPFDEQRRLVDIYFGGQRQALLGHDEAGPWQTAKQFFAVYEGRDKIFSHGWDLLGRDGEVKSLLSKIEGGASLTLLCAPGGMGKSRVLKTAIQELEKSEPGTTIRFVDSGQSPTNADLEDLGAGAKVIVVDDAHDRDGLGILLSYAALPEHQTRLVFATRLYALERIKGEALVQGLDDPAEVELPPLSASDLEALARQIFRQFGRSEDEANGLVKALSPSPSPLMVAMAVRIVAKDGRAPELAKNALRNFIVQKFATVISGDLGVKADQALTAQMLEILALVQPFHPQDQKLFDVFELHGIGKVNAERILSTIMGGGVAFQRGRQWRLMPDTLGDYLIEARCIAPAGGLSEFALQTLRACSESDMLSNVFVNLSRLDWRRTEGETAESRLLDEAWALLDNIESERSPRFVAAKAVAIYQPRQALDFVVRLVQRGKSFQGLSTILRNIAYAGRPWVPQVYDLLWELGRRDDRQLHQHPNHALRTLKELIAFEYRKPLFFCEQGLAFGLALTNDDRNWVATYTPLNVLEPLLSGDGVMTTSTWKAVKMTAYFVPYQVAHPWRAAVVDKVLELLRHRDPRISYLAAKFVSHLIQTPHGAFNLAIPQEHLDAYWVEFESTLKRILTLVEAGLSPVVNFGIASSVSWHASHGQGAVRDIAEAIMAALPEDVDFRFFCALADGWGQVRRTLETANDWNQAIQDHSKSVAESIAVAYPDPEARRQRVEALLLEMEATGVETNSAHIVMQAFTDNLPFANAVVSDAMVRPDSLTMRFAGFALHRLLEDNRPNGEVLVRRFLDSGRDELALQAASAYWGLSREPTPEDWAIFGQLLSHTNPGTVMTAIRHVWTWTGLTPEQYLAFLMQVNVQNDARVLDDLAMALAANRAESRLSALTLDQAKALIGKMEGVAAFDGHWINELLATLSEKFPLETLEMFIRRVEHAALSHTFDMRPINHGPYSHTPLRFMASSQAPAVVGRIWNWIQANEGRDYYFTHHASDLFEAVLLFDAPLFVEFFEAKLATATPQDFRLVGPLLAHLPHEFVFAYPAFVADLLERCTTVDLGQVDGLTSHLFASASSGIRSGTPGEPMPRDLDDLAKANERLKQLSRLSPAYVLYDHIKKSAEQNIARSKAELEAGEEEADEDDAEWG